MSEVVCPHCSKCIDHDDIYYCRHTIDSEYDVYYVSKDDCSKPVTLVYYSFDRYPDSHQLDPMVELFRLPGVSRALTKDAIERLLLLK